jgi:hypothetical protein
LRSNLIRAPFSTSPHSFFKNTLIALKALSPTVKAVIFAEEETEWNLKAQEIGLTVVPDIELNRYRVPFLRPILSHLEDNYDAPLYGYSHENLLFGKDLIDTLWGVLKRHCEAPLGKKVPSPSPSFSCFCLSFFFSQIFLLGVQLLLVGKRRNLKTTMEDKIESVQEAFQRVGEMRKLSKTFIREAMDFFFMTKGMLSL